MSFDLAVWPKGAAKSPVEAIKLYGKLCEDLPSVYDSLPTCEGIHAFYSELTAKHPEIDDMPESEIDKTEKCPWSVAFDRSDKHILMCAAWSKAEYVEGFVRELAAKHDLAMFNPQSGTLHLPGLMPKMPPSHPGWKFWQRQ